MVSKKIQDIVDRFVVELTDAAREDAAVALQDRLRGVLGSSTKIAPAVKRRKTTKGYTVLRPCPVPGCENIAAPRHQMVCKGHNETLTREEILVHRDHASKPGGIWYDLKPGRKVA